MVSIGKATAAIEANKKATADTIVVRSVAPHPVLPCPLHVRSKFATNGLAIPATYTAALLSHCLRWHVAHLRPGRAHANSKRANCCWIHLHTPLDAHNDYSLAQIQ